ncbi:exonuclease-domain-containing protein [Scenedesmus sp. NREL 46B-D3]|nr:exonuclease-domain-containing protein [Scenedesmus sp. NREL 46B-D3]
MVAIDAEFVAVARAETSFEGGVEVQLKPSRLALARVSVLRGSGPAAGSAFIDDYVACVEPVVDYLTRWSGIRPGDLDPATSQQHLVSLKAAYLKLHHLLDAGCVFIGHGLKQDFRMLNLTVPPEQVRDTVELFSFRRQRKLSLRFLASYLLGLTIQTGTGQGHDSIEDAATALALYNVYCKLQAEGKLEAKLHEMYRWGKQYGWEPVVHVNCVPQPPPGPGVVGLAPPALL